MPRTLKVELTVEEDDGRQIVMTLEGEDAEGWTKAVNGALMMQQIRGFSAGLDRFKFKIREADVQRPTPEYEQNGL